MKLRKVMRKLRFVDHNFLMIATAYLEYIFRQHRLRIRTSKTGYKQVLRQDLFIVAKVAQIHLSLGKYLASKPVKPIFKQVLGDGEKFVNVASIVVHPSYNTTFQDNDFALLKLSRDQCHKLLILTDTTARLLCPHGPRQFLEK